jgi:choice-of-anchor B domain-containing protein
MKKNYIWITLLLIVQQASAQFAHQNITLLSNFDNPSVAAEPTYGIRYQSCWGWTNPLTGDEYGIIGTTTGTYIIDVTNPALPIVRDSVSTRQSNLIWHEYKTLGNYLYIISDGPSNNQLQICDMSYLPDSVHVVYDSNVLLTRAHTITIDGNKMYLASVSSGGIYHPMQVYSLNNPVAPVLLRSLEQDYPSINQVHDMNVVHDTVYASCGNQGLYIYRYDSISNHFIEIGTLTVYLEQGYNHSSVLNDDHSHLYMTDETFGKAIKVVDVTTISNPTVDTTFRSHAGAVAHNPYVKGDYLYMAYYLDGVYVYNISDPTVPVLSGYFDTHPQNGSSFPNGNAAFAGCWAVYTDLPSGTLLASDMQYGLFCLDVSQITGIKAIHSTSNDGIVVYPNPVSDELKIRLADNKEQQVKVVIADLLGNEIKQMNCNLSAGAISIHANEFSSGLYMIRLSTSSHTYVKKINILK